MYSLCILAIASCLLSLVLTPQARKWSILLGLVDRPDGLRKLHPLATPRCGGLVILASYVGSYALLLLLPLRAGEMLHAHMSMVSRLVPPVVLIFLTGLIDDHHPLRPWQKLLGQLVAAIWAYAAGLRIFTAPDSVVPQWCGFLLTVGWLLLCSNGFNLVDGMDGLATGIGLTATLAAIFAGIFQGDAALALATAPLAGCLLGFLRYNFAPATVFLGDSGSLLIGFLLGCCSILWSRKSATMFGMAAPTMTLALPLLEVALSVVRRFLRGAPLFRADRGHIHHQLLNRGFQPRKVALLLDGACGVSSMFSLLGSLVENRFAGLVVLLFGASAWMGVQLLGYVEFQAAGQFLRDLLRPMLSKHVQVRILENELNSAQTVEQCWHAVEQGARSLGYSHVTAKFGERRFATAADHRRDATFWQMRLNLPNHGYLNITQREGHSEGPILLIPFVEVVRRVLPDKLAQLEGAPNPAVPETPAIQSGFRNSNTRTVISSDCAVPSVNAATAS